MKAKLLMMLLLLAPVATMQGSVPCGKIVMTHHDFTNATFHSDTATYLLKMTPDSGLLKKYEGINPWYGVQFYGKGLIFMNHAKRKFKTLSDYVAFGDFDTYYLPLKELRPGTPEYFSRKRAFPYPPGAVSFTKDGTSLYFSKMIKNRSGQVKYAIYMAKKDSAEGEWIPAAKPLSFCIDNFSYLHPAVSRDGKTLVFSSDMSGSRGGFDLFSSVLKRSGWSDPTNLGPSVNSGADELFPYLDDYNNLFFSSNRDSIPNGFDIYVARYNRRGWEKPFKPGAEINTEDDELMFKIRHNDTLALVVSFPDSGVSRLHFYRLSFSDSMKIYPGTLAEVSKPEKVIAPVVPVVTPKPKPTPAPAKKHPGVIFKVQILASMIPSGSYEVWIDHKKYYTWEYFYKGAYRYTIGEFDNVEDALKLKAICRQQGYPQAFVAAFRNNKRVLDPEVFKH